MWHDRPMYDPSMRVLTVLELLQTHGHLSGGELAARLEVSVRTVQRYVTRLQDLGIPVAGTRGPGGFYRLKPGFRLPPLMFGTDEAFAIALGLDALELLGLAETAPAMASVKAKLERVLPETVSARVAALRGVLGLERPRWVIEADINLLTRLASAVYDRRRVGVAYAAQGGEKSARVLEPLGLRQHEGRWFLAAYCLLREALRLFRVDRLGMVTVLNETFERPEFEMGAFLRMSIASVPALWEVAVWLNVPPEALVSGCPALWRLTRPMLQLEAGGTLLCGGVTDLDAFAVSLLQLSLQHPSLECAGGLEVRGPPELVSAFGRLAEQARGVVTGVVTRSVVTGSIDAA